jgi:GR25 family glycosyltransferase involved in LPS biosynthesis
MECYYVNLASSTYRNNRFLSEAAPKHFPQLKRFDAVIGKNVNLDKANLSLRGKHSIIQKKRLRKEDIGTKGALGCYLSHVGIWKQFLKGQSEKCLVFEDDADIKDCHCKSIKQLPENLEFDLLLLHRNQAIEDDGNKFGVKDDGLKCIYNIICFFHMNNNVLHF